MSEIRVRNLERWVIDFLRDRARAEGHQHLESFLRQHLRAEALRKRREWAARLKARHEELYQKYGLFSDSAKLIRQDREERG
jgi:hypothetical protein